MKSMKLKDGTIITFPDKLYSDDELVDLWAVVGWTHVPRRERLTIAEISRVEPDGYYIAMDGEYIVAHCGWVNRGDIFQTCGTKVSKGYKFRSYKGEGISNVLRQKRLRVIGINSAMSFINNTSKGWLASLLKEGWDIGNVEDLPEQYQDLARQLPDSYTILILNIKPKAMKKAWEILKSTEFEMFLVTVLGIPRADVRKFSSPSKSLSQTLSHGGLTEAITENDFERLINFVEAGQYEALMEELEKLNSNYLQQERNRRQREYRRRKERKE